MLSLWLSFVLLLLPIPCSASPRKELAEYFQAVDPVHRISGEYCVLLRDNYTLEEHFKVIGINLEQTAQMFHRIRSINGYRAKLDNNTVHNLIRHDPGVLAVEEDTAVQRIFPVHRGKEFHDSDSDQARLVKRFRKTLPTKSKYRRCGYNQCDWWHVMIQLGEKQHISNGDRCDWICYGGEGVHVYVLDTGVRINHIKFQNGNLGEPGNWPKATNFQNKNYSPYVDEKMDDTDGHGSHVAGIVTMAADSVHIINVKVLGEGASLGRITQAVSDVTAEHLSYLAPGFRGSVINMSLGNSPETNPAMGFRKAVKAAYDAGIPISVAAGNDNQLVWMHPAVFTESVVTVASVDRDYAKAKKSNFGPDIKISAPGVEITSCGIEDDYSYATMSGTSMASPFVAGTMALFVGLEGFNKPGDTATVYDRLLDNSISGALTGFPGFPFTTKNELVNIGWNNPRKEYNSPYKGGPQLSGIIGPAINKSGIWATTTANSVNKYPNDDNPAVWKVPGRSRTTSSTKQPSPTVVTAPRPKPTKCHCNESRCTAEPKDADAGCCASGTCGPDVPTDDSV